LNVTPSASGTRGTVAHDCSCAVSMAPTVRPAGPFIGYPTRPRRGHPAAGACLSTSGGSVPMPAASYRSTGRSQYPQRRTHHHQDDPERPQDRDVGEKPDEQEDQTEDDHCYSFAASQGEPSWAVRTALVIPTTTRFNLVTPPARAERPPSREATWECRGEQAFPRAWPMLSRQPQHLCQPACRRGSAAWRRVLWSSRAYLLRSGAGTESRLPRHRFSYPFDRPRRSRVAGPMTGCPRSSYFHRKCTKTRPKLSESFSTRW